MTLYEATHVDARPWEWDALGDSRTDEDFDWIDPEDLESIDNDGADHYNQESWE